MTHTPPSGSPKLSPDAPVDVSTRSPRSPLWTKPWLWLGVGLAVAALAYGIGRLQGAHALRNAEQRHATAFSPVQSSLKACELDRGLLTVRRRLAMVALALDRRNFGVAETHRRQASEALQDPTLSGLTEVASLKAAIGALNLSVDPDPGAKREQVIAASETLDRLLDARGIAPRLID
jgi:hypothetical protein